MEQTYELEAYEKKKIAKKSSLFTQTAQRIVIQWFICVKTYLRSSQVFTGLHNKANYFRFSQLKIRKWQRCDEA